MKTRLPLVLLVLVVSCGGAATSSPQTDGGTDASIDASTDASSDASCNSAENAVCDSECPSSFINAGTGSTPCNVAGKRCGYGGNSCFVCGSYPSSEVDGGSALVWAYFDEACSKF